MQTFLSFGSSNVAAMKTNNAPAKHALFSDVFFAFHEHHEDPLRSYAENSETCQIAQSFLQTQRELQRDVLWLVKMSECIL